MFPLKALISVVILLHFRDRTAGSKEIQSLMTQSQVTLHSAEQMLIPQGGTPVVITQLMKGVHYKSPLMLCKNLSSSHNSLCKWSITAVDYCMRIK